MTSSMTQNVMTSFDMTSFAVRMIVQFLWNLKYRYFVLSNYKCVNDIIFVPANVQYMIYYTVIIDCFALQCISWLIIMPRKHVITGTSNKDSSLKKLNTSTGFWLLKTRLLAFTPFARAKGVWLELENG